MHSPAGPSGEVVLLRLRRATQSRHQRLERDLDLMSPAVTIERYTAVVTMFASIYEAYEAQIDGVLSGSELAISLEWAQRRKLGTLRRDLALLGVSDTRPDKVRSTPPTLAGEADALGALYVMEGATLGGQYIAPHARRILQTEAVSFFEGYGAQRALRWQQYRTVLRRYTSANPDAVPRIEHAATETFDAFLNAYHRTFTDLPVTTT